MTLNHAVRYPLTSLYSFATTLGPSARRVAGSLPGGRCCSLITAFVIASAFLIATPAQAFRSAAIANESVELKQTADPNSPTLSILARGTRLNTSDTQTNGYFKVRTAAATGWVKSGDLYFYPKAGSGPHREAKRSSQPHARNYTFVLKAFAGADFWTPSDFNNLTSSIALNGGTGLGLEIGYVLGANTTAVLRIEHLSKSTTGQDANNGSVPPVPSTVTIDYAATPIMLGLDYNLFQWSGFSVDASGLLGLASPNLSGVVDNGTPTVFTGSAFTYLVKLDLNWEFSDSVWLYSELGYRSLKTGEVTTTPSSNFFLAPGSTSLTQSITLDMSGPVIDIGLRLNI